MIEYLTRNTHSGAVCATLRRFRAWLMLPAMVLFLAACSHDNGHGSASAQHDGRHNGMTHLDVYMTRTCGCCGLWVDHAEEQGFHTVVTYMEHDELTREKLDLGIGLRLQSCHTAVSSDGYVFEGHLPARLIHSFLDDVPAGARGLAVPGMPIGSPGMEMGDRFEPYDVLLVKEDGSIEVYARIESLEEQY